MLHYLLSSIESINKEGRASSPALTCWKVVPVSFFKSLIPAGTVWREHRGPQGKIQLAYNGFIVEGERGI